MIHRIVLAAALLTAPTVHAESPVDDESVASTPAPAQSDEPIAAAPSDAEAPAGPETPDGTSETVLPGSDELTSERGSVVPPPQGGSPPRETVVQPAQGGSPATESRSQALQDRPLHEGATKDHAPRLPTSKEEREEVAENQRGTILRPLVVFAGSTADDGCEFPGAVESVFLQAMRASGAVHDVQPVAFGEEATLAHRLIRLADEALAEVEDEEPTNPRAVEIRAAYRIGKGNPRTQAVDDEVRAAGFFWRLHVTKARCRVGTTSELCDAGGRVEVFRVAPNREPPFERVGGFSLSEAARTVATSQESGAVRAMKQLERSARREWLGVPGLGLAAPTNRLGGGVAIALSEEDGLQRGATFELWDQHADGSWHSAGYVKVRRVGAPGEPSFGALLWGNGGGFGVRGLELAKARPLSGVSLRLGGGVYEGTRSLVGAPLANAGISLELPGVPWDELSMEFEFDLGLGAGADAAPTAIVGHLGFRQRLQLWRFLLGVGAAGSVDADGRFGGRGDVSVEVLLVPWLSVGVRAGALVLVNTVDGPVLAPTARGQIGLHF